MQEVHVSIHFTPKAHRVEDVANALNGFKQIVTSNIKDITTKDVEIVLHHCFMPIEIVREKGWSEDIHQLLNSLDGVVSIVSHFDGNMENLEDARTEMMEAIYDAEYGGHIFVGDIVEGVAIEYELAIIDGKDNEIIHIELDDVPYEGDPQTNDPELNNVKSVGEDDIKDETGSLSDKLNELRKGGE